MKLLFFFRLQNHADLSNLLICDEQNTTPRVIKVNNGCFSWIISTTTAA